MRLLVQRVRDGRVTIRPENGAAPYVSGQVGQGFVALIGFGAEDGAALPATRAWTVLLDKLVNLRVFPDENDKMNRSLQDCGGGVLLISQFTLYADCRHGRRPAFTDAAPAAVAETLYNRFAADLRARLGAERVQCGVFGAMMDVALTNWGPVTIWLDSRELV